ncbi:E3 ubiquitin-protein ligase RING1-like [Mercurialis annua]|uniref:E3 ubiquitin-protein ligase RING1-like n=1 Tax=Mercurialis annua TaxID=3986 RepID=UPI0021602C73|nr:E3 ubiquitin-protein ligase RING1-like [Mercurialis annua]
MSRTNNFTNPTANRRRREVGFGYQYHVPNINRWNSSVPMFYHPNSLQDPSTSAYDPWRATPLGFIGFPGHVQQHPLLVLNNLARESAPRNFRAQDDDSKLSKEMQIEALKKLKKEIYNPTPKRLSTRLCLYYRDQAANVVNQMAREKQEDEQKCAVCLEEFEPKETVMMTPCDHMFHEACIVPWVKSHGQCPVCRFELCDKISGSFNNSTNDLLSTDLISILRAAGAI